MSKGIKYGWTGVEKLTVSLTYLNCQLSFESRVPVNDTPTHFVIVILVFIVFVCRSLSSYRCLVGSFAV